MLSLVVLMQRGSAGKATSVGWLATGFMWGYALIETVRVTSFRGCRVRGDRRQVRRTSCCIAVAAVVVVAATPAQGAFPGRNGMIAFEGTFACDFEEAAIGVIRLNGTGRRKVTACHSATDASSDAPDWSPDGNSLLYSNSRQIRLVDVRTAEERVIRLGRSPSFAPSGAHFAYTSGVGGGGRDIRRARIDGGASQLLRKRESLSFLSPLLWSPRGQTIAYYHHREGTWLMSARTGERLRRVTARRLSPLDWAPGGRRLLCVRGRPRDLYIVRADGKGPPRRLALTPKEYEIDAAWSPNGRRIAVLVAVLVKPGFHQYTIRTMSTSGTRKRRIWQTPMIYDYEESPRNVPLSVAWQPLPPRD